MAFQPTVAPITASTFKPTVKPIEPGATTTTTPTYGTTPLLGLVENVAELADRAIHPFQSVQNQNPNLLPQIWDNAWETTKSIPSRIEQGVKTAFNTAVTNPIERQFDAGVQLVNSIMGQPTMTGQLESMFTGQPSGNVIPAPQTFTERLQGVASSLGKMGANMAEMILGVAFAPVVFTIGALTPEVSTEIENAKVAYQNLSPDTKAKVEAVGSELYRMAIKPMPESAKDLYGTLARFGLDMIFLNSGLKKKPKQFDEQGNFVPAKKWSELVNEPLMGTKEAPGMIPQIGAKTMDVVHKAEVLGAKAVVNTLGMPKKVFGKFQELTGKIEDKLAKLTTLEDKRQAGYLIDKQLRKMGMTPSEMKKFMELQDMTPGHWVVENGYYDRNPQVMLANIEKHFQEQLRLKNMAIDMASMNPQLQNIQDPRYWKALEENAKYLNNPSNNFSNTIYGQKAIAQNNYYIDKFKTQGLTFKEGEDVKRMLESARNASFNPMNPSANIGLKNADAGIREAQLQYGVQAGIPQWQEMNKSIQSSMSIIEDTWKSAYPDLIKELSKEGLDMYDYIILGGGHLSPASLSTAWLKHQVGRFQNFQIKYMAGQPTMGVVKPDLNNLAQIAGTNIKQATTQAINEVLHSGQTDALTLLRQIEYDMNLQKAGIPAGQFRQLSIDDIDDVMAQAQQMKFPVTRTQLTNAVEQMQLVIVFPKTTTPTPPVAPVTPPKTTPTPKNDIIGSGGLGTKTDKTINDFYGEDKTIGLKTIPNPLPQHLMFVKPGDYLMVAGEPAKILSTANSGIDGIKVQFISDGSVDMVTSFDKVYKATPKELSKFNISFNEPDLTGSSKEIAFITPKEKGIEFAPENIDKFDYQPSLFNAKYKTGTKVEDIVDDNIKPFVKDVKIKIVDKLVNENNAIVDGVWYSNSNTILLRRQSKAKMDRILNHEIQHAIDKNTSIESGSYKLFPEEETTQTNDLIYSAERLYKANPDKELLNNYFDKKIEKAKEVGDSRKLKQIENAKNLFFRWLDEGKRAIA